MPTIRGAYPVQWPAAWRLDGETDDPHAPLVLGLHGMGMDEDSFALLIQKLFARRCRFLLPRAPFPIEIRKPRRIGASWYAYDGDADRFRSELLRTEALLVGLVRQVEREQSLRPRTRIVFGFSQGGYCGSFAALRHPDLFGGMIVSGARVKTEILGSEMRSAAALGFRALLCHGRRDASVTPEAAEKSHADLVAAGVDTELLLFDAGHALGREQVAAIASWLDRHFA